MKNNPADKVQHWEIDKLIPYARNSRTHSDEQVSQIAASMKEWGVTSAVLVDEQGGIIAGHGRVMAAKKLGMTTLPVMVAAGWTEAQKKAFVIADNKLALNAGWDTEMLALEVGELQDLGFDLSLTGFLDEEIAAIEPKGIEAGLVEDDEVPDVPKEAVTRLDDVWILGNHRVMCGDSTDAGNVALLMNGQKAVLLHADPPYGMGKEKDGVQNDNLYADKLDAFQMKWWQAFRPFLEDNASAYVWGNSKDLWRLWYCGGLANSERLTFRNEIIWNKKHGLGMLSSEHRQFPTATERCLFFMLGEQGFNNNADNYWDGWEKIRSALEADCKKMGWGAKDIEQICGVGMYGHWFTKSQWTFIPEEHYRKLQAAAQKRDAFKREYDAVKREYDELKREFYATRAYFDNTHEKMTDVWEYERVKGEERYGHATPKPVAMLCRAIKSSSPSNALVVEPFLGSGSTLIAAEKLNRKCYGMEISPTYCDVIVRRWQDFTGKKAIHEATGKTFDEVANG